MNNKSINSKLYAPLSILCLFAIWVLAAWLMNDPLLPGPTEVFQTMISEFKSGALITHMLATLARVAASFFLAMLIGVIFGILMGRSDGIDRFFDPWLILFLNIPALVVIFFAYIWGGFTEIAAVSAVAINKIPNVVVTMREGARSLSKSLEEMAEIYQYSAAEKIKHVLMPQLQPFIAASARSGLALIWKIVLVVEFLGRSNGMGFQIHTFFSEFNVAGIMAYSISFIIIMMLIEILIMQPMERHATRWRPQ